MVRHLFTLGTVFAVLAFCAALGSTATAQRPAATPRSTSGPMLYRVYCATCHGEDGRGAGPVADILVRPVADLTKLSERNDGVFPRREIVAVLDGTMPVAGHELSGIKAWTSIFRSTEGADDRTIQARLDALVGHLESMQARAPR